MKRESVISNKDKFLQLNYGFMIWGLVVKLDPPQTHEKETRERLETFLCVFFHAVPFRFLKPERKK